MSVVGWGGALTLQIEINFSGAVWSDVSGYLIGFDTGRGRIREIDQFVAGRANFRFSDRDGRFNPQNAGGAYNPNVRPAKWLRVRATYGGTTWPVWYGLIDSWGSTFPAMGKDSIATLKSTDAIRLPAAFTGQAQGTQGYGETVGARIARILTNSGWSGASTLDDGTLQCLSTDLSQNAWSEIQQVAAADGGAAWAAADGTIVYADRNARITKAAMVTPQATFGDGAGEVPYSDINGIYDDELVANRVTVRSEAGSVQVADATSGQAPPAGYGDRAITVDGWADAIAQLEATARYYLATRKDAEYRFTDIEVRPTDNPSTMMAAVLARQFWDRVTIKRRPLGGFTMSQDCFIEGIEHDVPNLTEWRTIFRVSSATKYGSPYVVGGVSKVCILGSSTFGNCVFGF